jgi:hypothetical protein
MTDTLNTHAMKCSQCGRPMEWEWATEPHNEICLSCSLARLARREVTIISVPLPERKDDVYDLKQFRKELDAVLARGKDAGVISGATTCSFVHNVKCVHNEQGEVIDWQSQPGTCRMEVIIRFPDR